MVGDAVEVQSEGVQPLHEGWEVFPEDLSRSGVLRDEYTSTHESKHASQEGEKGQAGKSSVYHALGLGGRVPFKT